MRRAFTAIELTIVIGVVAILSAIAMPATATLLDRVHLRAAIVEIESLFSAARHIAIARATQASVEIDDRAGTLSVTVDGDTVRQAAVKVEHGVDLTSNRVAMAYSATGVGYGAANLSIVVRKGMVADTVVVSRLGRVRH